MLCGHAFAGAAALQLCAARAVRTCAQRSAQSLSHIYALGLYYAIWPMADGRPPRRAPISEAVSSLLALFIFLPAACSTLHSTLPWLGAAAGGGCRFRFYVYVLYRGLQLGSGFFF
jgi:hypothetical protein